MSRTSLRMMLWVALFASSSVFAQSTTVTPPVQTSSNAIITLPTSSSSTMQPAPATSVAQPTPVAQLSPEEVQAGIERLKSALAELDTKRAIAVQADSEAQWQAWAEAGWKDSGKTIDHDQAVVVVNRNPKVQEIAIMVAHPNAPWTLIGISKTSTGQSGRTKHFITPTGVFDHDGSILDYRALGTKNENGIRGIGAKGSRVWDFGWQQAQTGWLKRPEMRDIRLELHATDPDLLEQRLGHPASQGCVRIGAGLNKFLDTYGILDAIYIGQRSDSRAVNALLPKNSTPVLPGRYMVVVDIPNSTSDEVAKGGGALTQSSKSAK